VKITTWNVNGIRAALTKGAWDWVQQEQPDVLCLQEIKARSISEPAPGRFVFDIGQNMVGWVRLKVQGQPGTEVVLRFAEMLNPDGTIYTTNLRAAKCTDRYVLKGGSPRFTSLVSLSMAFGVDYFWLCLVIASALKWATLRWSGLKGYRQFLPIAFGIIIGEYLVGAMWSVVSIRMGQFIYDFSPG
jgi:hypothetical protein